MAERCGRRGDSEHQCAGRVRWYRVTKPALLPQNPDIGMRLYCSSAVQDMKDSGFMLEEIR